MERYTMNFLFQKHQTKRTINRIYFRNETFSKNHQNEKEFLAENISQKTKQEILGLKKDIVSENKNLKKERETKEIKVKITHTTQQQVDKEWNEVSKETTEEKIKLHLPAGVNIEVLEDGTIVLFETTGVSFGGLKKNNINKIYITPTKQKTRIYKDGSIHEEAGYTYQYSLTRNGKFEKNGFQDLQDFIDYTLMEDIYKKEVLKSPPEKIVIAGHTFLVQGSNRNGEYLLQSGTGKSSLWYDPNNKENPIRVGDKWLKNAEIELNLKKGVMIIKEKEKKQNKEIKETAWRIVLYYNNRDFTENYSATEL